MSNPRRNVPSVEDVRVPRNSWPIAPWRSTPRSSLLSAPAAMHMKRPPSEMDSGRFLARLVAEQCDLQCVAVLRVGEDVVSLVHLVEPEPVSDEPAGLEPAGGEH